MTRIMALIDFSQVTPAVVRMARDMARAFAAELLLVHVVESECEPMEKGPEDLAPAAVANRCHKREMEIISVALKKEGVNASVRILEAISPGQTIVGKILHEIGEVKPQVVVIGSHGHGRLHQLVAGSVSDTIMRKACCPVLLVPSRMVETGRPKPNP
ncbi:MAG TPA: universal stress protein [Tepidisphaeraceae bacterium]|jgi:nucleotide-binding universal stress UspA family protein|nr:universal stress protein [Tepidisphaeraceae bacterium]